MMSLRITEFPATPVPPRRVVPCMIGNPRATRRTSALFAPSAPTCALMIPIVGKLQVNIRTAFAVLAFRRDTSFAMDTTARQRQRRQPRLGISTATGINGGMHCCGSDRIREFYAYRRHSCIHTPSPIARRPSEGPRSYTSASR